ncbi:hypothetical protein OK016_12620 [Vibrio chagasii]|nr:hypothetical protein [Vibrio chagasii]
MVGLPLNFLQHIRDYRTNVIPIIPQYAKKILEAKDLTAFRYLERMFTRPKNSEIRSLQYQKAEKECPRLYGVAEKRQAAGAIKTIENLVIELDLVGLRAVLFDIYYDRATADFIFGESCS